jgi:pantoate--beta-alanine ligase
VAVSPTRRERDGLAMSSRNKYLDDAGRGQATVLSRCLAEARRMVRGSAGPVAAAALDRRVRGLVAACPDARLDYVAYFDPEGLTPLDPVGPGARMALAVFVGSTRLIDNGPL